MNEVMGRPRNMIAFSVLVTYKNTLAVGEWDLSCAMLMFFMWWLMMLIARIVFVILIV